jgi:hypothetical protein
MLARREYNPMQDSTISPSQGLRIWTLYNVVGEEKGEDLVDYYDSK